jgi:O-antigen ligase
MYTKIIEYAQKYIIYLFIFSLNFETVNLFYLDIDYLASKISIGLLIFISIINYKSFNALKHFYKILIPIIFYFFWLTYTSFVNRSSTYNVFINFPFFLNIVILVVLIINSKLNPDNLLKGLLVFSFSTFVLSILSLLGMGEIDYLNEGRLKIFGLNQNLLGIHLCVSLLVLISVIFENRLKLSRNSRYLLLFLIPSLFTFMVQTGSRLSMISFVLGVIFFILLSNRIKTSKKIFTLLGVFCFTLVVFSLFLKNSLIAERLFLVLNDGDTANREIIWLKLLDVFSNNYFFGVGETGYAAAVGELSPHNVFIEVLLYTGIFGLFIFLIFLLRIIIDAIKRRKFHGEMLPLVLVLPILGTILTGQILGNKIYWVLFAYICRYSINIINFQISKINNLDRENYQQQK